MAYQNEDREMFDAVCAECGQKTQVPFKPSGDRPVYCSNCYKAKRGSRSAGPRASRQMFDAVCAECGQKTQVPFKPSGDRPVYCIDCYKKKRG
jgi:CxxC-x17-CxxC domain-containing protein